MEALNCEFAEFFLSLTIDELNHFENFCLDLYQYKKEYNFIFDSLNETTLKRKNKYINQLKKYSSNQSSNFIWNSKLKNLALLNDKLNLKILRKLIASGNLERLICYNNIKFYIDIAKYILKNYDKRYKIYDLTNKIRKISDTKAIAFSEKTLNPFLITDTQGIITNGEIDFIVDEYNILYVDVKNYDYILEYYLLDNDDISINQTIIKSLNFEVQDLPSSQNDLKKTAQELMKKRNNYLNTRTKKLTL